MRVEPLDLVRLRRRPLAVGVVTRVDGDVVEVRPLFEAADRWLVPQASIEITGRYSGSQ
jgi:hypothetical protein